VRFGKVFVLVHEHDDRIPEVPRLVLFQAVADDFCFANVGQCIAAFGICPEQEIDPGTFRLFPQQQVVQFNPSPTRKRLASPCGRKILNEKISFYYQKNT
jgi:hypothetical protein